MRTAAMYAIATTSFLLVACARPAPGEKPGAQASAPVLGNATANADPAQAKKPRFGDAAVYVDGKSVGVMRYLEMPPSLKPTTKTLPGGYEITRYGMMSYFKALGLDPTRIKGAHFYGGRRVGLVTGDELRRVGDDLKFSFTQKDRGKPRIHRARAMQSSLSIDMLSGVAIYVDKEPPTIDEDNGYAVLLYPDGKKVTGVPYANEEQGNGTRLYVDGKLTATLKRKTLSNAALLPGTDAHPLFSLPVYLDTVGVDAKKVRSIDLVAGDDVVSRSQSKDVKTSSNQFSLPAKSQGKAVFDVPKANGDGHTQTAHTRISAIHLYVHMTPPARTVTPPEQDDVPGAPGVGNQRGGNGGGQGGQQDDEG